MNQESVMDRLIQEAGNQQKKSRVDSALDRIGYKDGWFVLKGELVRKRPLRWAWSLWAAIIIFRKWNAPKGHDSHSSLRSCWNYGLSLAEILDEPGEGYLTPHEAINIDREYWDED